MSNCDKLDIYHLLIKKIECLEFFHEKGEFYCQSTDIWKENRYNRYLVYYSPRIINSIKHNNSFEITYYDDIYFALIQLFIEVTGYELPVYYRTNGFWLRVLIDNLTGDEDMKKAIISILLKCTKLSADKEILSVLDIKNMPEYRCIIGNIENKQG